MSNSTLTTDAALAANFSIHSGGKLFASDMEYSTDLVTMRAVGYSAFAAVMADEVGSITTVFFSQNTTLRWVNQQFPTGAATFCENRGV
jgi:hypothetical protein